MTLENPGVIDFIVTPDSGHSAFDPPNSRALVAATDRFAAT